MTPTPDSTHSAQIVVDRLKKRFGKRVLWEDVSFTIDPGEMVALTGRSGSGKSTLLNCIGLLETVNAGSITVSGRDITRFGSGAARTFRRDSLGYLFQNYALIENASIDANLAVATGAQRAAVRSQAPSREEALERVGLGGRGSEPVYQLSGGEQQRVALARLMVKNPSVVLADEPTGALDHGNSDMVIETLATFAAAGNTVLIATHSDQVTAACDRRIDLSTS